jgi:hypothetical protein
MFGKGQISNFDTPTNDVLSMVFTEGSALTGATSNLVQLADKHYVVTSSYNITLGTAATEHNA